MSLITSINKALADLHNGKFVLVHDNDNRENETDLVMASQYIAPSSIKKMRKEGGGLIFLMISNEIAEKLQLPYLANVFSDSTKYPVLDELIPNDIPYDTRSSFSLPINHRKTFTGITDNDRSLTMKRFAELTRKALATDNGCAMQLFGEEFRSPGHVPVCIAEKNLLTERTGHTELSVSLMKMASLIPVAGGCEVMGDDGQALPKNEAKKYAEKQDLVFLEGKDIIKAWKQWSK